MKRTTVKREPTDNDNSDDNDNDDIRFVAATPASAAAAAASTLSRRRHNNDSDDNSDDNDDDDNPTTLANRDRKKRARNSNSNNNNSNSEASSSASPIAVTSVVSIPLAELTALQQQVAARADRIAESERARAEQAQQFASMQQQNMTSQQQLTQQLVASQPLSLPNAPICCMSAPIFAAAWTASPPNCNASANNSKTNARHRSRVFATPSDSGTHVFAPLLHTTIFYNAPTTLKHIFVLILNANTLIDIAHSPHSPSSLTTRSTGFRFFLDSVLFKSSHATSMRHDCLWSVV